MKTEKWYHDKLLTYFIERYGDYEEETEFSVNPGYNKWEFHIPSLEKNILLVCYDTGKVVEYQLTRIPNVEDYYDIVKSSSVGLDAVYEDHIINLIGRSGLLLLRSHGKIELCGLVNGRTLYTLA